MKVQSKSISLLVLLLFVNSKGHSSVVIEDNSKEIRNAKILADFYGANRSNDYKSSDFKKEPYFLSRMITGALPTGLVSWNNFLKFESKMYLEKAPGIERNKLDKLAELAIRNDFLRLYQTSNIAEKDTLTITLKKDSSPVIMPKSN